jgi:hypothetical protein
MVAQPAYFACRYFLIFSAVYIFQPGIGLDIRLDPMPSFRNSLIAPSGV